VNTSEFIPFHRAAIGNEEIEEVVATLRSGWLTSGPRTAQFEREFREYTGARSALAVNSCTAGLHLALAALDIKPGDEVITTPLTFCATVNAILHTGAVPVLADIGPDLNIDPAAIRAAITSKTKAILPVHMAGLPCDMDSIWQIAREHNLRVVEDAAHAAGTMYKGRQIGSGKSDAVAFSFYATKNITTGEGGMVTTESDELAARMKVLCLHGINRDAWNRYSDKGNWFYEVGECGFKYNMSDVLSAIGIHQLRKIEAMTARRREIVEMYNRAFGDMPELELPPDNADARHAWHLYVLRLNLAKSGIDRAGMMEELRARGVGASVHFIPIPLHPFYKRELQLRDRCLRALEEYPRMLSLPLYPSMSDEQVSRVINVVRQILLETKVNLQIAVDATAA
jgi:dTDP-4-amino-4,6-dideoxygalactose transaminase